MFLVLSGFRSLMFFSEHKEGVKRKVFLTFFGLLELCLYKCINTFKGCSQHPTYPLPSPYTIIKCEIALFSSCCSKAVLHFILKIYRINIPFFVSFSQVFDFLCLDVLLF